MSTYRMNKKRSERRKHCMLAVVRRSQKISPSRRPLPGGTGQPKFNQLEMVTTFTYKPSLVRIDACNFDRDNIPTNKQTNKHSHKPTNSAKCSLIIYCNQNTWRRLHVLRSEEDILRHTSRLRHCVCVCVCVCVGVYWAALSRRAAVCDRYYASAPIGRRH